jgi:hypothetical protein
MDKETRGPFNLRYLYSRKASGKIPALLLLAFHGPGERRASAACLLQQSVEEAIAAFMDLMMVVPQRH